MFFALRWGLGQGLLAGFAFGLLQLIFDGAYAWGWQSMLLDYLVAFTPLGLAGLFRGKAWGIFPGTALGCAVRFLVHFISGITIGGSYFRMPRTLVDGYNLVYNGSYMLPNMLLALAIAAVLYIPLKKYFAGQDIRK